MAPLGPIVLKLWVVIGMLLELKVCGLSIKTIKLQMLIEDGLAKNVKK